MGHLLLVAQDQENYMLHVAAADVEGKLAFIGSGSGYFQMNPLTAVKQRNQQKKSSC